MIDLSDFCEELWVNICLSWGLVDLGGFTDTFLLTCDEVHGVSSW